MSPVLCYKIVLSLLQACHVGREHGYHILFSEGKLLCVQQGKNIVIEKCCKVIFFAPQTLFLSFENGYL